MGECLRALIKGSREPHAWGTGAPAPLRESQQSHRQVAKQRALFILFINCFPNSFYDRSSPLLFQWNPVWQRVAKYLPGTRSEKHLSRRDRPRARAEPQAHTARRQWPEAEGSRLAWVGRWDPAQSGKWSGIKQGPSRIPQTKWGALHPDPRGPLGSDWPPVSL